MVIIEKNKERNLKKLIAQPIWSYVDMVKAFVKVDDNFASLQHQMAGTNSAAGKGPSAVNVSDDETSPKSCVIFHQLH